MANPDLPKDINVEPMATEKTKGWRIWKADRNSQAAFVVTPDTAMMVGNEKNFIAAGKTGVAIVGSGISFVCNSDKIRQGGLFVNMNDFMRMIPSTIVTPMPAQIPFPPTALAMSVLMELPAFLANLA